MKAWMASGFILEEKQVLRLHISLSSFTAYSFFWETWLDMNKVMTLFYKAHCNSSELLLSLSTHRSPIFFSAYMMPQTQILPTRFSVSFCSNTLHTFSAIFWVRWRRQKVKSGGLMQSSSLSSSRMAEGCSLSKSFSIKSSKSSLQTSSTAWLKRVEMPSLLTILKGEVRQSTTLSLSWLQQVLESLWLRWSLTSLMASGPWQAMIGAALSGKLGPQGSAMTWLLSIMLMFSSQILLSPPACLASNLRSGLISDLRRPSTVRLAVFLNSRQRKAMTLCISSSKLLCLASIPRCSSMFLPFFCRNSLSLSPPKQSMKRSTSTLLRLSASMVQKVGAPSSFISVFIYTNLILAEVVGGIYNFNMDYFLIFRFEVLEGAENAGRLESLEAELVRPEEEKLGSSNRMQFTNLTFATNFRQAVLALLKKIQDINNNFVNIQLVCEDSALFTHILPAEFAARSLTMPYCLTNFLDWRAVCREKYGCVSRTLQETAKFLNLMELSDTGVMLKLLLRKLREEKAIVDTEVAFVRRFESRQVGENFAYFRCIGLPFQISKNELVQRMIEPERYGIKNYGLSLIFEHGKFSGKAVLKVPAEFAEMVLRKDRMYIGRRYVQISTIGRQDFEGYKMREQKQRQESRGRQRHERSSSSSRSRSRSRQKLEIHSLLNEAAVKVRGLPYSLNSWDIEQIFKRFNFVRGSIKLGFLGERKSGEAVILFPNREEAERAMHLQGFVVQGRYLELKVITKQNYDRFK